MHAYLYKRIRFWKVRSQWPHFIRPCKKRVNHSPGKWEGQVLVLPLEQLQGRVPGLELCGAAHQAAASVSSSHLPYCSQQVFFSFISWHFEQKVPREKKFCSAWNFWKWEKCCNVRRILMVVLLDDSTYSECQRGIQVYKHCSLLIIFLKDPGMALYMLCTSPLRIALQAFFSLWQ